MNSMLTRSIRLCVLVCALIFSTTSMVAQVLLKPELKFSDACSSNGNRDFQIGFRYNTSTFQDDNLFTLELSDANGSFAAPVNLATVANKNATFSEILVAFQLPDNTNGSGYKIRIKADKPRTSSQEMFSPESDAFAAYLLFSETLWINDNKASETICGSGTVTLTLNTDEVASFDWFKDGALFATTTDPFIEVSEQGKYQGKINYFECGYVDSRLIDVYVVSTTDATIQGGNEVEICSDETYTFEASISDISYTYNWYLEDQLVASSNSSTYTTPNTGQFGTYHLVLEKDGCEAKSQDVELKQKTDAAIEEITGDFGTFLLLPGENKKLEISVAPSSVATDVVWLKNDVVLQGVSGLSMNPNGPGTYKARVTETGTSCPFTQDSDVFELVDLQSLSPSIRTASDYVACGIDQTKLLMVGITATGTDGNTYELSDTQVNDYVQYQWYKGGNIINGATQMEYAIASYQENDSYTLEVSSGNFSGVSDAIDVQVTIESPEILSSSTSNALCTDGTIVYTIEEVVADFTYTWFKDGEEIETDTPETLEVVEEGVYFLQISGFGCVTDLESITVVPFDDSAVEITPSEVVVVLPGQNVTVTASGANSYEWYEDSSGSLLSTNETLEINTVGTYTLIATVDDCEVVKTIEAVEQDDQIIVPNIVSPYLQDGINDTWTLSNKYAFQPSVTIAIYDANGVEVLRTNEYKNDWPNTDLRNQHVFYYKIIRDDMLIKAGSISVLD